MDAAEIRRIIADQDPKTPILMHFKFDIPISRMVLNQIRENPMDEHSIRLKDNYYKISDGYYAQDNTFVLEAGAEC